MASSSSSSRSLSRSGSIDAGATAAAAWCTTDEEDAITADIDVETGGLLLRPNKAHQQHQLQLVDRSAAVGLLPRDYKHADAAEHDDDENHPKPRSRLTPRLALAATCLIGMLLCLALLKVRDSDTGSIIGSVSVSELRQATAAVDPAQSERMSAAAAGAFAALGTETLAAVVFYPSCFFKGEPLVLPPGVYPRSVLGTFGSFLVPRGMRVAHFTSHHPLHQEAAWATELFARDTAPPSLPSVFVQSLAWVCGVECKETSVAVTLDEIDTIVVDSLALESDELSREADVQMSVSPLMDFTVPFPLKPAERIRAAGLILSNGQTRGDRFFPRLADATTQEVTTMAAVSTTSLDFCALSADSARRTSSAALRVLYPFSLPAGCACAAAYLSHMAGTLGLSIYFDGEDGFVWLHWNLRRLVSEGWLIQDLPGSDRPAAAQSDEEEARFSAEDDAVSYERVSSSLIAFTSCRWSLHLLPSLRVIPLKVDLNQSAPLPPLRIPDLESPAMHMWQVRVDCDTLVEANSATPLATATTGAWRLHRSLQRACVFFTVVQACRHRLERSAWSSYLSGVHSIGNSCPPRCRQAADLRKSLYRDDGGTSSKERFKARTMWINELQLLVHSTKQEKPAVAPSWSPQDLNSLPLTLPRKLSGHERSANPATCSRAFWRMQEEYVQWHSQVRLDVAAEFARLVQVHGGNNVAAAEATLAYMKRSGIRVLMTTFADWDGTNDRRTALITGWWRCLRYKLFHVLDDKVWPEFEYLTVSSVVSQLSASLSFTQHLKTLPWLQLITHNGQPEVDQLDTEHKEAGWIRIMSNRGWILKNLGTEEHGSWFNRRSARRERIRLPESLALPAARLVDERSLLSHDLGSPLASDGAHLLRSDSRWRLGLPGGGQPSSGVGAYSSSRALSCLRFQGTPS